MILKAYIFALLYGVLCLGLAFLGYKLGMQKKYTRKLVHILVGFEWVILYGFLGGGSIHFLNVCIVFTLLLLVTYFRKLTPMIASDADNAPGTVYYGVAMSIMATVCLFVPHFVLYFGIGVFCTSLGDGFAGLVGQTVKKYNPKIYGKKSLLGFLTNLLVSFGMVGALSIVRFRTAVKNPLDLLYLFWSVSAGIICGVNLKFKIVNYKCPCV